MVDQRLVSYVRNGLAQGHSPASIHQSLIRQGWPQTDVNQAIRIAQSRGRGAPVQTTPQHNIKGTKRTIIIIVIVFLFLLIGITLIVGIGLFSMGVLNPASYMPRRCNGFQYFTYLDQQATTSSLILQLRNGVNEIKITSISVVGTIDSTPTISKSSTGEFIEPGKEFTVRADGLSLVAGDYDDLIVEITYEVKNGIVNTDTASCIGSTST